MSPFHQNHRKGLNGINFLRDISSFLTERKEQVDNMLGSARAAQRAFKGLLDMKLKQANVVGVQVVRKPMWDIYLWLLYQSLSGLTLTRIRDG